MSLKCIMKSNVAFFQTLQSNLCMPTFVHQQDSFLANLSNRLHSLSVPIGLCPSKNFLAVGPHAIIVLCELLSNNLVNLRCLHHLQFIASTFEKINKHILHQSLSNACNGGIPLLMHYHTSFCNTYKKNEIRLTNELPNVETLANQAQQLEPSGQ